MGKILIVEDDLKIAQYLADYISKYEYNVVKLDQFEDIMTVFNSERPDLVLLDVNLPSYDGYYWCRQIRKISIVPVIFISARTSEMDQVMALENGGDDFITKPFHPDVVMAKIRSHMRRAYGEYSAKMSERVLDVNGLKLFPEQYELEYKTDKITLTKKEADIVESLMSRYPRVAGREDLLEKLWDKEAYVDENTLNVNVTRVRKKFLQIGIQDAIETIRGAGYRLVCTWNDEVK